MLTENYLHDLIDNLELSAFFAELRKNASQFPDYQTFEEVFMYEYTTYRGVEQRNFRQSLKAFVSKCLASSPANTNTEKQIYQNQNTQQPQNTPYNMQQSPQFFIDELKSQITEQYQSILRYRKLRNDEIDNTKRQAHQQEIQRCQSNIKEIETDFLQNVVSEQVSTQEAQNMLQQTVEAVRQEMGLIRDELTNLIKTDLQRAIEQVQAKFPQDQIQQLNVAIAMLGIDQMESIKELASIIFDVFYAQKDTDTEIAKIIPMLHELKRSDSIEAKLKIAVPLLKQLGLDLEIEAKLNPMLKNIWARLSGKKS